MDADADFHLVLRQIEGRLTDMWYGTGSQSHAHASAVPIYFMAQSRDVFKRLAGFGSCAANLLCEDRRADAAPAAIYGLAMLIFMYAMPRGVVGSLGPWVARSLQRLALPWASAAGSDEKCKGRTS